MSKRVSKTGKPVKRVSALRRKKSGYDYQQYIVRCWWVFRGAVFGMLVLGLLYGIYQGAGKIVELDSLSVKTIDVQGCMDLQPEVIRHYAGVVAGEPLLKIDLREVRQKVITHPSVKDATVVRELPDTLRISIKERIPAAVVLGRDFALVDSEGTVLGSSSSYTEGYPVITGIKEPLVPGRKSKALMPAMEVLGSLTRSGLIGPEQISELQVQGSLVRVSLMGSGTVLLMRRGDVDDQVIKLVRLMEAGVFNTGSAGYDLRFEGRVIGMPQNTKNTTGKIDLSVAGG